MGARQSQPGHSSMRFDSRLLRAVFRNDVETVEYLISHHSDLNIVEHGHGALNVALHVQNKQVAKLLLDAGIDVNNPRVDMPVLTQSALLGWVEEVEMLLRYGADIDQKSKEGMTVLHYLALQPGTAHLGLLFKLVKGGGDLNSQKESGDGVLHCLARTQDSAFLSRFMSFPQCNFNLRNNDKCTPLMVALKEAHFVTATALVSCGCDVNLPDGSGTSPLEVAVCYNFVGAVKLLLQHGARIQQAGNARSSALHYAATHGNPQILDMLLRQESLDINMVNFLGQTALHVAAAKGSLDAMQMLMANNAELMCIDNLRRIPLHLACQSSQAVEAVTLLLSNGCPRDPIDQSGRIPLHTATSSGNVELMRLLLHRGNVNITDNHGRSPLVVAVQHGHVQVAEMLIEMGALVDLPDNEGHCPLFTAIEFPRMDLAMVQLLLRHDCDPLNLDDMLSWMITNSVVDESILKQEEPLYAWYVQQRATPKPLKQLCRVRSHQLLGIGERDRPADKVFKAELPLPVSLVEYLCVRML